MLSLLIIESLVREIGAYYWDKEKQEMSFSDAKSQINKELAVQHAI